MARCFSMTAKSFVLSERRTYRPPRPSSWSHNNILPHPMIPLGRALMTKQVVHVADARTDEGYIQRHPGMVAVVELGGARTLMVVPMLKENELIGAIGIYRQEVRPFTDWPDRMDTPLRAPARVEIIEEFRLGCEPVLDSFASRTTSASAGASDAMQSDICRNRSWHLIASAGTNSCSSHTAQADRPAHSRPCGRSRDRRPTASLPSTIASVAGLRAAPRVETARSQVPHAFRWPTHPARF